MRKLLLLGTSVAVLAMVASCTLNKLEEPGAQGGEQELVLRAIVPQGGGTKLAVSGDGPDLLWAPQDRIIVYHKNWGYNTFQSRNDEPAAVADFNGYIIGSVGDIGSDGLIWALYPVPARWSDVEFDEGKSVTVKQQFSQTAQAGTFDPSGLLMMARSANTDLSFYHVGGGLKFKLTQDWIQQVEFRSNDGTPLAGKVTVKMDGGGIPQISKVEDAEDAILLTVNKGETFQTDTWYYLCCLPANLEQGFTLTFRSEDKTATVSHPGAVEVKRAVWGTLENADSGAVPEDAENMLWNEIRYTTTDGEIFEPYTYYASWDGESYVPTYKELLGAELISNTYESGQGVMLFDGPVTVIPNVVFTNRSGERLETIGLPATVRSLEDDAFMGCSSLKEVKLPAKLKKIGSYAFGDCSALEEILLPDGLISIGEAAFRRSGLKQIEVPAGIQTVGPRVFEACVNLTTINGPLATQDGRGLVVDGTLVSFLSAGLEFPVNYSVEEGITGLGEKVFYNDYFFNELTLPESLESIGYMALAGCNNLMAFHGKYASEDGHLLVKDGEIVGTALQEVQEFTVPGSVKAIAPYAFSGKWQLETLVLEEGVERIGDFAFFECGNLHHITLPESLTKVGQQLFRYANNIQQFHGKFAEADGRFLVVEGALKGVAASELANCIVPEGVTRIDEFLFRNSSLATITLPEGLTEIGEEAFGYCHSLTGITLPQSLQKIETYAFVNCDNKSFTSFTIPAGVKDIGYGILSECSNLVSITVLPATPPATQTWQPLGWGFHDAPIYVPAASLNAYKSADGWRNQTNYQAIPEEVGAII